MISIWIINVFLGKYNKKKFLKKGDDFIKPIQSKEEYQIYVDKKTPNSPILLNCIKAFLIGGLICSIGQIIFEICKTRGIDETTSYTIVSMSLIFASAFLTG